MKRYPTYLASIMAAAVLLITGPAVAQIHFGLPSAVKSTVKKLKSKKNTATASSIVLSPLAMVLTSDTNSKFLGVAADSVTYHYSLNAGQIAGLVPGNIIMSSQGYGYLKKVVSLTNTGSEYQVLTTTAGLNEAFDVLKLRFHKTVTPADTTVQSLPQATDVSKQFNLSTNTIIFDGDGNYGTTNDQITTMLGFMFSVDVDVDIDMPDPQHLNRFLLTINSEKELNFNFGAKVGVSISKEFPLSPEIKVPIWEAPPLVLKISPKFQTTLSLGGGFDLEVAGTETSYTGVICDNDCLNGNNWRVEGSSTSGFGVTKASGSAQLSLQMGPAVGISALLGGIVGPFFELGASGKAAVTTPVNHLPYTVSLVAEAKGGVKAEIDAWFVNVTLFSIEASLLNYEYVIKDGVLLNQSPQISALTPSTTTVAPGGATTVTCSASDPEGDSLTYAWSAASGTLSSMSGNPVTWTAPSTPGTYTITCVAADGWGGSVQKSTNVVVFTNFPGNNAPVLSWTGESNYTTDGIHPETGTSTTTFIYRVKYADADNDAPANGYPKVHILKAGVEISGSPFVMTAVDSYAYTTGRKYTYSRTLPGGGDYTYYFEAQDVNSLSATGTPASLKDSPDVAYVYTWNNSIADSENDVPLVPTTPSLAMDSNGYPQIVYDGWRMRHAVATQIPPNDATWTKTDLSNSGFFQSAALGLDDSLHIAYRDANGPCCGPNYIKKPSGQSPSTPIPVGGGTSMDSNISIALDSSNNPYISYTYTAVEDSYGNGVIHCAWRNGSSWIYLTDVGAGKYSSVSVGPNGYPHIAYLYTDANGTYLRYARWDGSSWVAASQFDYGSSPSIKVDSNNYPHIAYGNKYIEWDGSSWTSPPQTTPSSVWPSLVLDSNANPHIAYTASGNVYYTKRSSPSSSWDTPQTALTGTGLFGIPPLSYNRASLVLENGKPRIAVGDSLSGYLVYIWGQ